MSKIVIVDGNSIMFRAYYATAYTGNLMQTSTGIYTNAIYTFIVMMQKILATENMTNLFIAFDKGKKTLRHQEYDDYKGTRKKMPEELAMQIPFIKEYLDVIGINRLELDDYEADDIVGTIATKSKNIFDEVEVISGDKDLLQLVGGNIKVFLTKKGLTDLDEYNESNFFEKLDFTPTQLIDYKGLVGDSSDNLPGIPGIGPKTATKLLKEYHTLENIIDNATNIKGKTGTLILENKDQALKCKKLATIYTDAIFDLDINETLVKEVDKKALRKFYERFEFTSFIKRLGEIVEEKKEVTSFSEIVLNPTKINISGNKIYLDIELSNENNHRSEVLGISLINNNNRYYLNENYQILKDILLNNDIDKVTTDSKKLIIGLNKLNINVNNITFDLTLASYLVDPSLGSKDIKDMIEKFIPTNLPYSENVYGKKRPYVIEDENKLINYSLDKLSYLEKVESTIVNKLKEEKTYDLLTNMELPLSSVLARVEINGFKIDLNRLKELGNLFNEKIAELEKGIYDAAGHEFNIASPKQLGVVIFEEMCLAKGKKNKTGYSTSADVLEKLAKNHPFPKMVLEYRKYAKLVSTYVNGLESEIYADGLLHTTFKQALTLTGRLSSVEPNIQNIPVRTEEGRLIRSAFIPRYEDGILVSADYSQIELRVLATIAKCDTMIKEINEGIDFHTSTAAKIHNIPLSEVTKEQRRIAKAVNFGIVYGMSAFGLSEDLGISVQEANDFIYRYFEVYPEIKAYLNNVVNETMEKGYTTTYFNRRRYIPEIQNTNFMVKEFGKRTAMNAPIQGTAADIMKLAMIAVDKKLKQNNLKSKLVAQVHDELIVDATRDELFIVMDILKETMSSVVNIGVLLDVDVEVGANWNLK